MKYAWIENDTIRDTAMHPAAQFHPAVAALYTTVVGDDVQIGWQLVDGEWVAPAEPAVETPEAETVYPKLSPVEFKMCFTSAERIAIKAKRETDPVIDDIMEILDDPRLQYVDLGLQSNRDSVDYLIAQGCIDANRRDAILAGQLQ